ncbi:toxin-antitoxin system HicB family antitoxin [Acidovorax sp.]|uniref:toxin-antitoxin system HicB family antitoxin n=1 Tax=Acidovorax sp. TaxID=1872122 RepID=UPI00391F2A2A
MVVTLFWCNNPPMEDEDRYTRITLRIPKDLHSRLTEEAERTSKSLNAEIVGRLTDSFQPGSADTATALPLPELIDRVEQLQAQMDAATQREQRRMLLFELDWIGKREAFLTSQLVQGQHRLADFEDALAEAEEADHMAKAKKLSVKIEREKRDNEILQKELESLSREQQERSNELRALL